MQYLLVLFLKNYLLDDEGLKFFLERINIFLKPLSTEHPPLWFLILTPILVIISIPIAYYLFLKNKNLTKQIVKVNQPLYQFLLNKWYFDELYEIYLLNRLKE